MSSLYLSYIKRGPRIPVILSAVLLFILLAQLDPLQSVKVALINRKRASIYDTTR